MDQRGRTIRYFYYFNLTNERQCDFPFIASTFQVHKIIVHDEYKPFNYAHDIALIRTVTDTPFSDYIQPACLWHDDTVPNDPGWVTGFSISHGDTGKSNLRDILSQAQMPIVSSSKCLKSNPDFFNTFMGKYNYCAGYRNGE